ncbi:MAG: D-2-hydroxyacid dehydrogenase [Lachnospiraceae bacterium]|nr:D-2-hydroxyacid dehydrogenase [Lachnospiraceae bacterium]
MKAVYLEEGAVNKGDITLKPIMDVIETKVYYNTTEEDKFEHIGDAEVVFSNKVIFDEETFKKCPNLKYIGVCATGYNVIDIEAAKRHGVTVTNVPAYSTDAVAQLTWGFIIELVNHISVHNKSIHEGEWCKSEIFCYWLDKVTELSGKTLGVIGYGNIGRKVTDIALIFGMKVLVYTAHPDKYEEKENMKFVSKDEVFKNADIITLHCPMNDETKGMICKENIEKMKDGIYIVNVSRGGLVNEQDLADALKSGKVAGAAADVVSVEPIKEDNPLLGAPNMILTPHIGWASVEARERLIQAVADNLKAYLNGEKLNVL